MAGEFINMSKIKRYTSVTLILALMLGIFLVLTGVSKGDKKDFIKYAEFNVCYSALEKALEYDINTHKNDEKVKIDWVQVLAYLGAKYGGDFKQYKEADLEQIVNRLKNLLIYLQKMV